MRLTPLLTLSIALLQPPAWGDALYYVDQRGSGALLETWYRVDGTPTIENLWCTDYNGTNHREHRVGVAAASPSGYYNNRTVKRAGKYSNRRRMLEILAEYIQTERASEWTRIPEQMMAPVYDTYYHALSFSMRGGDGPEFCDFNTRVYWTINGAAPVPNSCVFNAPPVLDLGNVSLGRVVSGRIESSVTCTNGGAVLLEAHGDGGAGVVALKPSGTAVISLSDQGNSGPSLSVGVRGGQPYPVTVTATIDTRGLDAGMYNGIAVLSVTVQ